LKPITLKLRPPVKGALSATLITKLATGASNVNNIPTDPTIVETLTATAYASPAP